MNGYFEGEYIAEKQRRPAPWDMWNPKNYFELKITANPAPGIYGYTSINMLSNANGARIFFNQGHLTFHKNHVEFTFFSREDRFWLDSPLLFLVNTDRVRDESWGPKAEGARLDFWKLKGFFGTGIAYKFRSFHGEGYLTRFGKNLGKSSYLALLYLKKDWHKGIPPTFNEVSAFQSQVHLRKSLYFRLEFAKSIHPVKRDPEKPLNTAIETEFRYFTFKNLKVAFSYFNYGLNFTDEFSNKFNPLFDHEFGRKGFYSEWIYMVPGKAINLIYKIKRFKTRYQHPRVLDHFYNVTWQYGELYVEFIGGINTKLSYENWKDWHDNWEHLLFEIIGENKRMRIKLQYKIKDIGINTHGQNITYSIGERHLLGLELRVNITPSLQFYGRGAWGMGVYKNWNTLFLQLAYRKFQNTEIYLEYGDPGATDDDLVNDFDIADNPYQKIYDKIKLLVKFWF